MDQDSFRMLLSKPGESSSSRSRGPTLGMSNPKSKTIDTSKPAFKPRKVKPTADGKYRDRATERRLGQAHDFTHVEAVLDEFEKQIEDGKDQAEIERKRKYLGGDSEHSVLVKGLDFALLEQNKARAALANDSVDDDTLEQAFSEVAKPMKRTREDIIRELKEKRAAGTTPGEQDAPLGRGQDRKNRKFKPIGFKPIGMRSEVKRKKEKVEGKDGERKKRKVEGENVAAIKANQPEIIQPTTVASSPTEHEPEPVDEDLDIFADAGEYGGLDLDLDDDDDGDKAEQEEQNVSESLRQKWIDMDDDVPILPNKTPEPQERPSSKTLLPLNEDGDMEDDERPMRLVPLASSALPDIKELLEMDKASASWNKNRKKKDKKKTEKDDAGGSKVTEAKVERDYQRLKAYTDKKS